MSATLSPAAARAASIPGFFDRLACPGNAALFDAKLIVDMLLAGTHGDADPAALLDSAIASLQAARAAMVA